MRRIEIFRVAVDGVCGVLTENPIDTCGKATEYGALIRTDDEEDMWVYACSKKHIYMELIDELKEAADQS